MIFSGDLPICGSEDIDIHSLSSNFGLHDLDRYSRTGPVTCYTTFLRTDDDNMVPGLILSDQSNMNESTFESYPHRVCNVRGLASFGYMGRKMCRFVIRADRLKPIPVERYEVQVSPCITTNGFLRSASEGPASCELFVSNVCIFTGNVQLMKIKYV